MTNSACRRAPRLGLGWENQTMEVNLTPSRSCLYSIAGAGGSLEQAFRGIGLTLGMQSPQGYFGGPNFVAVFSRMHQLRRDIPHGVGSRLVFRLWTRIL